LLSKSSLGMALASLIVMSGSAFADDFFYFQSGNSTGWNNVQVNPYTAVDKSKSPEQTLSIYCDDWNSEFGGNPYWYASVTALTDVRADPTLLNNLKYGNSTENYNVTKSVSGSVVTLSATALSSDPPPLNRYLEAAWLDNQWRTGAYGTLAATQIKLAAAGWLLFVDGKNVDGLINAINGSGHAENVFNYLDAAQKAIGTWDASGWSVITPDTAYHISDSGPAGLQTIAGAGMQEFLFYSAPEPGAVILLGTVLGILGLTKFRRRLRA